MLTTSQKYWQRWLAWRDGSVNGRIFKAMLVVAGGTFVVNITAVLRELAVAYQFGTSDELDSFLIAFMIPLFMINVLPGSIQAAFIPAYVDVGKKQGQEAAAVLLSNVLSSALLIMLITTAVLMLGAEYLLATLVDSFSEQKFSLTIRLFYILQPILIIRAAIDVLRGVLNAQDRFALAAVSPILMYLVPTVFILVTGSIVMLAVGTLVGHILQAAVLFWAATREGIQIRWQWPQFDNNLKSIWLQYLPMVFGALIMGSSDIIDQTMATWLGSGSVSSLVYGQRVSTFILGIAIMAIGTAILPNFSKMISEERWQEIKHTVSLYTFSLFLLTIPIVAILWWLSEPITLIFFQRGAFTAADTALVSNIQAFYFLQIPSYVVSIIFVRLISALKKNQFLTYGAVVNVAVNILGNLLFMRFMGLAGIALSTALVYLISSIYLACVAMWLLSKESYVP